MKKKKTATVEPTLDRRSRVVLANSGQEMESGEVRDTKKLYVMGRDGKLIRVADLNTNPDEQTEKYSVAAQADHGQEIDGELVPTVEKQFGSCRVWLDGDALKAKIYFADGDELADHAYAISGDAGYSTGIDWYPRGYQGAGQLLDFPLGILREISMVLTGNDPRARALDKLTNCDNIKEKEEILMEEKKPEAVEEVKAVEEQAPVAEPETPETAPGVEPVAEKSQDTLTAPVQVRTAVKQEVETSTDWLTSKSGHMAFADTLRKAGRFGGQFDNLWRAELSRHMSLDGITGLPTPAGEQIFTSAFEESDGIISHFTSVPTRSLTVTMVADNDDATTGRAGAHVKGEQKVNEELTASVRSVLNLMVYKKLDLDAMELWENPELIDFRTRELAEKVVSEIERAAIVGDGRDSSDSRAMFQTPRGFYSVKADAEAGAYTADAVSVDSSANLYDAVVTARAKIRTAGRQFLVTSAQAIASMLLAKTDGGYLINPGGSVEAFLGVDAIYTPTWMDDDSNLGYLIVNGAYTMIGQNGLTTRAEFDTSTNTDILLDETPRGGSLTKYKSAIALSVA